MLFYLLSFQIKAHLKETDSVSIKHVHSDYSTYENVAVNADDFRHVIEIYNFPALFKTNDLLNAFIDYRYEMRARCTFESSVICSDI